MSPGFPRFFSSLSVPELYRQVPQGGASEVLKELVPGDLNLAQDAVEQPRANHFAGVNRNDGFSSIAMPQEMVAPPHTDLFKSHPLQSQQKLFA